MLTLQDEIIANYLINKHFSNLQYDKRTPITANEIAQYLCEWYPEMFEHIAANEMVFRHVSQWIENANYHSYTEIAEDILGYMFPDNLNIKYEDVLALNYGYDDLDDFERDYLIITDNAIDGFLIL